MIGHGSRRDGALIYFVMVVVEQSMRAGQMIGIYTAMTVSIGK